MSALCACGRQRGPTELSSHAKVEELSWGLGWQYSFWQSFRRLFFCAGQRAFLGQLRALKGRSRTEDLGFREILRRIYFKVCMFGFNSSTPCLLLSGSNLDASLTPQSKAALPDTDLTARQPPLNACVAALAAGRAARIARSPTGPARVARCTYWECAPVGCVVTFST